MAEAAGLNHGTAAVQVIEAGEGVGLQRALEAGQVLSRMLAGPSGGEAEHCDRGLAAAARPGVVGIDPEAAVVSAGATRIEHGHGCVVGMDLGPPEQQLEQAVGNRRQIARGRLDPAIQRGGGKQHAEPGVVRRLPVQRHVVEVLGDDDLGDGAGGGQAPLDRPIVGRRRLGKFTADLAGELGPDGDVNLGMGRHEVELFALILADPGHLPAAARALRAGRQDLAGHPRQSVGQRTPTPATAPAPSDRVLA